jgi:putative spermidine/putrescine transport system permease protein
MATMTKRRSTPPWAVVSLLLGVVFFLIPLLAMARFAFQRVPTALLGRDTLFSRWTAEGLVDAIGDPKFGPALTTSLKLAAATVILTLAIMLPTVLWVHLAAPRMRSLVETISLLPYVVPPIALVVGASGTYREVAPWFLRSDYSLVPFYAILAMPFTFRSLDVGIRSLDLRTLVDAGKSLGASPVRVMSNVIVPNLRSSIIGTAFLTITVVLGEFTIASLLLKQTLPLYMAEAQGRYPQGALGLGLVLLVLTAMSLGLLTLVRKKSGPRATTTSGVFT